VASISLTRLKQVMGKGRPMHALTEAEALRGKDVPGSATLPATQGHLWAPSLKQSCGA